MTNENTKNENMSETNNNTERRVEFTISVPTAGGVLEWDEKLCGKSDTYVVEKVEKTRVEKALLYRDNSVDPDFSCCKTLADVISVLDFNEERKETTDVYKITGYYMNTYCVHKNEAEEDIGVLDWLRSELDALYYSDARIAFSVGLLVGFISALLLF